MNLRNHHRIQGDERPERGARPALSPKPAHGWAIVPIFGGDVDNGALRAAARLAGDGATAQVLYVLRVPDELALGAGLDGEERLGRSVLERAEAAGRQLGLTVHTR